MGFPILKLFGLVLDVAAITVTKIYNESMNDKNITGICFVYCKSQVHLCAVFRGVPKQSQKP